MNIDAGTVVDSRFRILMPLRSGGMGSVYVAEQLDLQRNVALKFLHPSADIDKGFKRFRLEAKILSRLKHPNIVMIHCFGTWNELFYISMEYIESRSLEDLQVGKKPLSFEQTKSIMEQLGAALSHAHSLGVVHRDLKPSNIMIADDGHVKLIDFGLSKPGDVTHSQDVTAPGTAVGTVSYMSPEQCMGQRIDYRSDIYSLGCVLYHMIVGTAPFVDFNPVNVMSRHVNEPLPQLSADVEQRDRLQGIIDRATMKAPHARYHSVDELLTDLRSGDGTVAPIKRVTKPTPTKLPPAIIAASIAGLIFIGAAVFFANNQAPQPESDLPLAALREHAVNLSEAGQFDEARDLFNIALTKHQSPIDLSATYGSYWKTCIAAKQYDEAIAVSKRWIAATKPPQVYHAVISLAESYREKGDLQQAMATWKQCREMHAMRDADAYLAYSLALREIGNYKEALAVAQQGLSGTYEDAPPPRREFGHFKPKDEADQTLLSKLRDEVELDQKLLAEKTH